MIRLTRLDASLVPAVSEMVLRTFDTYLDDVDPAGAQTFYDIASTTSLGKEMADGEIMWVALDGDEVAGFLGMSGTRHLKYLFVDGKHHRKGIARKLWETGKQSCLERDDSDAVFTVNSSDYAVAVYESLGFHKSGERQIKKGLVFTPLNMPAN